MVTTAAARSDLDLCLLGPLRVSAGGSEVSLGGPRQMAVLARLMVTPGQVVSMEQLIDSVWDGGEPARPHVTVRSYVSNLRRAIEPKRRRRAADSCIASSPPGYRLAVQPAAIDWIRFQRLLDEARALAADGDDQAAVVMLRRALGLWRGEACAGLPASEVFEAHRVRLTALRQTAVELLYESLLNQGQHDAVATDIEAAIVADPLRERLTELGMLTLYRAGRQSEALALGQRLRERLRDGLGIDPSPAIEQMELRILNHDRTLHIEPVAQDEERAEEPDAPPGQPTPAGTGTAGPVGRRAARRKLAEIDRALDGGRLAAAAVVGEAGSGKTVLVRELTERLADGGARIARASTVSESPAPLWPWAQIVLDLIDGDPRPVGELTAGLEALAGLGRSVANALGLPDEARPATPADTILAVSGLVARSARHTPVVLVLEDLDRADRASVTMLEYVISALTDEPVGIVATWPEPDADTGPVPSALRGLGRLPDLHRIDLLPMDAAEIGELAASFGVDLTPQQITAIRRRSGGNPRFAIELLSAMHDGQFPLSPALRALVVDRVERVHPLALAVLRSAALFRGPFAADDVAPLHPGGSEPTERVIAAALRAGVLAEDDPSLGTCRFRHPLVQEVLAVDLEPGSLRDRHRMIGGHLLDTDEVEASYHLSWSPDPGDRALAARVAIDVLHRGARTVPFTELDGRIRNGLTAAEALRRAGQRDGQGGDQCDDLVTDILGYLSWRARVEDRPVDWADNGRRNLRAAMDELTAGAAPDRETWSRSTPATPLRGVGGDEPRHRPLDRLERSILNLIGQPILPAGPGDPLDFLATDPALLDEVRAGLERLPPDNPARLAGRVHLLATGAGPAGHTKALRDAATLVAAARNGDADISVAPAVATIVARFADELTPAQLEELLEEHAAAAPGRSADLLWARHGYPALLASGRLDAAAGRVEDAVSSAEVGGDALQRAEARFLLVRHLLWLGELDQADRTLEEAGAELAAVGLPEPLPLARQRRVLRSLRGLSGDDVPGASVPGLGRAPVGLLASDRVGPAEAVFRLAHLGQRERAAEHLARLATPDRIERLDLAELALLGVAATAVSHRAGAELVHQRLVEAGDRLIVRHDGSSVYGPATLWAAVAAHGAGRRRKAQRLLESGLDATRLLGGTVPASLVAPVLPAEDLPIELQPNLKPAGAN